MTSGANEYVKTLEASISSKRVKILFNTVDYIGMLYDFSAGRQTYCLFSRCRR